MKKLLVAMALMAFVGVQSGWAQNSRTDLQESYLHGKVRSVLTTTRGAHGQMIQQPVRYNFNERGDFERTTYYDTLGNPGIVVNYIYDDKGRLLRDIRTREPFSELILQTTYITDKKKRTLTLETLGIEDSICDRTVREFDKRGFLVKEIVYDDKGVAISATTYKNDKEGKCVEATYEQGPNYLYAGTDIYRYDQDGNAVEKRTYFLDKLRQDLIYVYEFDDHGNWVSCTTFHVTPTSAEVYHHLTREFVYFD